MNIDYEHVFRQTHLKTINKMESVKIALFLNINKQIFITLSRKYSAQKVLNI